MYRYLRVSTVDKYVLWMNLLVATICGMSTINQQRRRVRKLARAREDLERVRHAIKQIEGGAQQYSMGSRSLSKASLATLYAERDKLEDLIDALEHPGARFKRVVPLG